MRKSLFLVLPLLLAACGGGSPDGGPRYRPALAYGDPPPGGWRWVANPSLSAPGRLVLELQGPGDGSTGRGVVFDLQADPSGLAWVAPRTASSALVENVAFIPSPGQPVSRAATEAGRLQGGIFQLGRGNAVPLGGPLCRVALAPRPGLPAGTPLALANQSLRVYGAAGTTLTPQVCKVGTLTYR